MGSVLTRLSSSEVEAPGGWLDQLRKASVEYHSHMLAGRDAQVNVVEHIAAVLFHWSEPPVVYALAELILKCLAPVAAKRPGMKSVIYEVKMLLLQIGG